jgi:hypothetical protein
VDSQDYARREGRPQLRNLLLPRTKGWQGAVEGLKGGDLGIYDFTVGIERGGKGGGGRKGIGESIKVRRSRRRVYGRKS